MMIPGLHIDIPDNEENKALFETDIDWEKEEEELKKEHKEKSN